MKCIFGIIIFQSCKTISLWCLNLFTVLLELNFCPRCLFWCSYLFHVCNSVFRKHSLLLVPPTEQGKKRFQSKTRGFGNTQQVTRNRTCSTYILESPSARSVVAPSLTCWRISWRPAVVRAVPQFPFWSLEFGIWIYSTEWWLTERARTGQDEFIYRAHDSPENTPSAGLDRKGWNSG